MRSLKILFTVLVIICVCSVAVALLLSQQNINFDGSIAAVNVEIDKTEVHLGLMAIGETKTDTVTVTNTGTLPVNLSFATNAPYYIHIGWDKENVILQPNESTVATVWVRIMEDTPADVYDFSFSGTVTGTQTT